MYSSKFIRLFFFIILLLNCSVYCDSTDSLKMVFNKFGDELNCEVAVFLLQTNSQNKISISNDSCCRCDILKDPKLPNDNNKIVKYIENKKLALKYFIIDKKNFDFSAHILIYFCLEKIIEYRKEGKIDAILERIENIKKKYKIETKFIESLSNHDSTTANVNHTHPSEISLLMRLFIYLSIILSIISTIYVLIKKKSLKKFNKQIDNILKNLIEHSKSINNIEFMSNIKKEKLEEIEKNLHDLSKMIFELKEIVSIGHIQFKENELESDKNTNKIKPENIETIKTYYLQYPNKDGVFIDNKTTESGSTRPFILIIKEKSPDEGEFDIVSSESLQKNLINNYHIYLNSVADIEKHNENGNRITVNKKGELELKDGKWYVKEKLKINIE
jgi:hypothetical protein